MERNLTELLFQGRQKI